MTGPEHYREAERLIAEGTGYGHEILTKDERVRVLAAAQVHATLALAAATVVVPATRAQVDWLKTTQNIDGVT